MRECGHVFGSSVCSDLKLENVSGSERLLRDHILRLQNDIQSKYEDNTGKDQLISSRDNFCCNINQCLE